MATQVQLEVTHSVLQGALGNRKAFAVDAPISSIKEKLYMVTGTEPRWQRLQLKDPESGNVVAEINDDSLSLGDYGVQLDWILHVIDTDPARTLEQYTDEAVARAPRNSTVENTVRAQTESPWRRDHRLKARDTNSASASPQMKKKPHGADSKPDNMVLGDRVEDKTQHRQGVIRFVGEAEFGTGWWVGVAFTSPLGKNDGSLNGVRYFDCEPNHGSFFPPNQLIVVPSTSECDHCEDKCTACDCGEKEHCVPCDDHLQRNWDERNERQIKESTQ